MMGVILGVCGVVIRGSNKSLKALEPGPSLEPVGESEAPTPQKGKGRAKQGLEMVEKMEERSRGKQFLSVDFGACTFFERLDLGWFWYGALH